MNLDLYSVWGDSAHYYFINDAKLKVLPAMAKKRKAVLKRNSSQSIQINGHHNSSTPALTTGVILVAIMMIPLPACGVVSLNQAMAMFDTNPDLWIVPSIFFALGVFLVGLYFYALWRVAVWEPSVTLSRFALIGDRLEFTTRKHGATTVRVGDLITYKRQTSNHILCGWWLRFRTIGWVYLDVRSFQSRELLSRIAPVAAVEDLERLLHQYESMIKIHPNEHYLYKAYVRALVARHELKFRDTNQQNAEQLNAAITARNEDADHIRSVWERAKQEFELTSVDIDKLLETLDTDLTGEL